MSEKEPTDDSVSMSRRKLLGSAALIGGAGALGAGGTSALFWDEEVFGNVDSPNVLQAGALDLKVDWDVRYYDGIAATDPADDQQTGGTIDATSADNEAAENGLVDQPGPLVQLTDIKPGDVIEKTLSLHLYDNPGFVSIAGEITEDSDNGITEPEDKVNGHEADDSDGDPFANAGIGLLGAGLLGSATGGRVFGEKETAAETETETAAETETERAAETETAGQVSRKNLLRAGSVAGAGAVSTSVFTGEAAGAPGDLLAEVDLPEHTGAVGITFDGTYVYTLDGLSSQTLQIYEPPSGGVGSASLVAEKQIVDSGGNGITLSAVEWDTTRGQLWGAYNSDNAVYLVDVNDPTDPTQDAVASFQFAPNTGGFSLTDGLAYDARDDTLWYSPDVDQTIWHFQPDGTEIKTIQPVNADGNNVGVSGVAVGDDIDGQPTLYIGKHGPEKILRVDADDGSFISEFSTANRRIEDLACDPVTYDSEAILTIFTNTDYYWALEVEDGTCPIAGEEPDGDEGDGELDNLMECVVWYDGNDAGEVEGGDNFPAEILPAEHGYTPGGEQFLTDLTNGDIEFEDNDNLLFEGSLREMLDSIEEGQLLDPAGSRPEDFEFPDSMCFDNSTTHFIGVLCWLPRDIPGYNDNIVQTDTVEYYFGFNAIQCRHNVAEDGGPISGTIAEADAENNAFVDGGD